MSAKRASILVALVLAGLTMGAAAVPAKAQCFGFGGYYYSAPPAYYAAPPVYVAPAPVYAPPPVYYYPAPRVYMPTYRHYSYGRYYYPRQHHRSFAFGARW